MMTKKNYDSLTRCGLGTILTKLQADQTGASLTTKEKVVFNEVGLSFVSILGETQRTW